jgi:hypothetical protein
VAQVFVREVDPADPRQRNLYAGDEDQALYVTLALSRLVRPHAAACDYAVRRIIDTGGSERLVPYDAGEVRPALHSESTIAHADGSITSKPSNCETCWGRTTITHCPSGSARHSGSAN